MTTHNNNHHKGKSHPLNAENAKAFLHSVDNFIFDCDGVLWRGNTLIPGADEALEVLRQMGKKLFFVTNNSTKSRETYVKTLAKFDIHATKEEIMSSSYGTAAFLQQRRFNKKAYILGGEGIVHELQEAGIEVFENQHHNGVHGWEEIEKIEPDNEIGAVICGFDINMNYYKTAYAYKCLKRNKECLFIATNLDSTFPGANDRVYPGGGSTLSPLVTSTGRKPIVMGKPETLMLDVLVNKFHLDRSRTAMVGDRLDTDIVFGQNGGLKTLLVLTGVATLEQLNDHENQVHPDFYLSSISNIKELAK